MAKKALEPRVRDVFDTLALHIFTPDLSTRPSSSNGTENNAKAEILIEHSFQPSIFQVFEPLNRCNPFWA
jgi:hypothetical protein